MNVDSGIHISYLTKHIALIVSNVSKILWEIKHKQMKIQHTLEWEGKSQSIQNTLHISSRKGSHSAHLLADGNLAVTY